MDRIVRLREYLANCRRAVRWATPIATSGRLTRVSGLVMEAVGLRLPVGSQCHVQIPGGQSIEAEVAGFSGDRLFIMPATDIYGVMPGARVIPDNPMAAQPPRLGMRYIPRRRAQDRVRQVPVGEPLLGRVLDGAGRPLDGLGPLSLERRVPLYSRPINPLERAPIRQTLDVGVRAINGLLTVGRGQRLGLFAGSGVGKSILLGMMARYTDADVVVVGLIGERGREVKEFIDRILGAEGMARAVVVAAPADHPPLMRLNGAAYAMSIAEYFRDQGKHVLLIMDSLTRYAMAQREVALAIGEPPATKGYPPSVFAKLPQLAERAGNGRSGSGSITAFFTVLMEGDDQQDPIADAARAILDGHIVLSRDLADAGHYPAIDVEASISRVQPDLLSEEALERTRRFKYLYSRYMRSRDLLAVGAYVPGADLVLDEAVRLYPRMQGYLMQGMRERASLDDARAGLDEVLG
ncbi:MAG: flagellar protein export ATPase FliI [Thiobacillus sp.]|nr:flagellar protein export ATPase FliI [Thiobacillus sp.]MDP2978264.1 flagellar protein export ATPase FliI [Thiobacillus sp.]